MKVKDVSVDMNKAVPLGLIINELITNALKHAFPDNKKGTLLVSLQRKGKNFELIVQDNGVGSEEEINLEKPKSLGLQLVNALTAQLQGEIKVETEDGTKFTLIY